MDAKTEMVIATFKDIAAVASDPIRNDLEVGFRHSPLSEPEIKIRMQRAFEEIAAAANAAVRKLERE